MGFLTLWRQDFRNTGCKRCQIDHLSHEKRAPGWLDYIGDDKLPSYIGDYNTPL